MKKYINVKMAMALAVASIAVLAGGCDRAENYEKPTVYKMEYEGHRYLVFRVPGNYGQSYVLDPSDPRNEKAR